MADLRRRDLIGLLGGAVVSPLVARAQHSPTIGFLHSGSEREWTHAVASFRAGLKEAGYMEAREVTLDYRWADDQFDRLPALAADLASRQPALMFAGGGAVAALAAKRLVTTMPLLFAIGADPVKMGLVSSLNRPGGNATGVSFLLNALVAKRLEFLRELAPSLTRIGVIVNPDNPNAPSDIRDVQDAAGTFGLQTDIGNVRNENEIEGAFGMLRRRGAKAFIVLPDPSFLSRRNQIVAAAAQQAFPGMYFLREFAVAGGLMSYSASLTEAYRLAGAYAGRILKGEKPADLPVVQPTKFEFVINLKTAKALGLAVPPSCLLAPTR